MNETSEFIALLFEDNCCIPQAEIPLNNSNGLSFDQLVHFCRMVAQTCLGIRVLGLHDIQRWLYRGSYDQKSHTTRRPHTWVLNAPFFEFTTPHYLQSCNVAVLFLWRHGRQCLNVPIYQRMREKKEPYLNTSLSFHPRGGKRALTAQIKLTCRRAGLQFLALLLSKNLLEVPGLLKRAPSWFFERLVDELHVQHTWHSLIQGATAGARW